MPDFKLKCLHPDCSREYEDHHNYRLHCDSALDGAHGPALLRAIYEKTQIDVRDDLPGVFKYIDWMPVDTAIAENMAIGHGRPLCYKSAGLAKRLGLKNLYIAFSGYWPERGGELMTRTFKEFECQASIARYLSTFNGHTRPTLIVSSAGNTANGYNLISHLMGLPIYLVVPEIGLDKLILPFETKPYTIAVRGDYSDAIAMAREIAEKLGFLLDGGVLNIARRAGMGAVMLHAVAHPVEGSGELFDHYFQAVGSASGAIAAWEAVQLLLADGRFGDKKTQIHMGQNLPFTPIADAWEEGLSELAGLSDEKAREKIAGVTAMVLTNRTPPYAIPGGIFDTLKQSEGTSWKVNNYQLFQATRMFSSAEGVDIGPAAAVAVDALSQAVEAERVAPDDHILLHITGGGKEIQFSQGTTHKVVPTIVADPSDVKSVIEKISEDNQISLNNIRSFR